jgi:hypothetical protein
LTVLTEGQRMSLQPECARGGNWIDGERSPPCGFVAAAVGFAMMAAAERDGELIADLARERAALGKAQMVGIAGPPAANEARLLGDVSDMVAVAQPARLGKGQHALVDALGLIDAFGSPAFRRGADWR